MSTAIKQVLRHCQRCSRLTHSHHKFVPSPSLLPKVVMFVTVVLAASILVATANGAGEPFSYEDQGNWPSVCVSGNTGRQSPINIQTSSLTANSNLIDLVFGDGWDAGVDGTFNNGGHNVQFDPSDVNNPSVTTRNHLGTYQFLQVHMHWGRNNQEGSEHTVNGEQYSLELHFVHTKVGETNSSAGDYLAVVGVFAEADPNMQISGAWAQLNASAVRTTDATIPVTNFVYSSLLPSSREYYYYIGSLTTPGCSEVVQWFVLRDSIRVPADYLAYLRQVESANENETLTYNFRDIQALGQRSVYTVGNGATAAFNIVSSLTLVLLVSMLAVVYISY